MAVILSEQSDSASIVSTCEYYGYELSTQSSNTLKNSSKELFSDKTNTYIHSNGSTMTVSFKESGKSESKYSIEVTSKISQKDKDQILKNLNFKKIEDFYERSSFNHITRCYNGKHGSLIFQKHPKIME
ncbi:MAG: hypothetical protein K2K97_08855 [Muribaculaceae bacterium]|nr:hypothetical protein [Muribaculaceae bacterium]